jgi:hypothetical protein
MPPASHACPKLRRALRDRAANCKGGATIRRDQQDKLQQALDYTQAPAIGNSRIDRRVAL